MGKVTVVLDDDIEEKMRVLLLLRLINLFREAVTFRLIEKGH